MSNAIASATWSDVHRELRAEGVPDDHAMARADLVRIELERRLEDRLPTADRIREFVRGESTERGYVHLSADVLTDRLMAFLGVTDAT